MRHVELEAIAVIEADRLHIANSQKCSIFFFHLIWSISCIVQTHLKNNLILHLTVALWIPGNYCIKQTVRNYASISKFMLIILGSIAVMYQIHSEAILIKSKLCIFCLAHQVNYVYEYCNPLNQIRTSEHGLRSLHFFFFVAYFLSFQCRKAFY